ncbi:MAG: 3-keto-5-aminohexanoate cleavage protein [Gammaproteobacteria bacterium]
MTSRGDARAPSIMAAINGARRGKKDHPALPTTTDEIARTAAECYAAGADSLHLHIRDEHGAHSLDAGRYRETLAEIKTRAPKMATQITTESAGKYPPNAQRKLLRELRPFWASVSLAEMFSDGDEKSAARLYFWAAENEVRLQHILYRPAEVSRLAKLIKDGAIPAADLSVLFVLGKYAPPVDGAPEMLKPFLRARLDADLPMSFMACAFGKNETECLLAAAAAGGDCRVGFENNLHNRDGSPAADNAERVSELVSLLRD